MSFLARRQKTLEKELERRGGLQKIAYSVLTHRPTTLRHLKTLIKKQTALDVPTDLIQSALQDFPRVLLTEDDTENGIIKRYSIKRYARL